MVSKAKKAQIFKWLVRKHGCSSIELQSSWTTVQEKKVQIVCPTFFMHGSDAPLQLVVDCKLKNKKFEVEGFYTSETIVYIPCRDGIISYADVLDWILALMKKNDSECRLRTKPQYFSSIVFLKKGTTLENLAVEFDLAWPEVMSRA